VPENKLRERFLENIKFFHWWNVLFRKFNVQGTQARLSAQSGRNGSVQSIILQVPTEMKKKSKKIQKIQKNPKKNCKWF
jgi:hypothetical protein